MSAQPAGAPVEERSWPGLDVSGLRILVTGFGVSGYAIADQTMQRGAQVLVVDGADTPELRERAQILEVLGVEFRLGPKHLGALPQDRPVDLVVTSPGWRPDQPVLVAAQAAGIPVWSEIELARRMQAADGPAWLGITGTNGKTTTVTMLESILVQAGLRAVACGNVGLPVIEAALDPEGFDVLALELSSFQLHWTEHLDCEAAVVLNVSADHLDWHGGAEAYAAAKGRIFEGVRTACIYNVADPVTRSLVEEADVVEGARAVGLTLGPPGLSELGVIDGILVDRAFLAERRSAAAELATLEDLAHLGPQGAGPHLVLDALAAAALARAHGVEPHVIRDGLSAYRMGSHRAQHLATIDGVDYVDDTKATNPAAAAASLRSAERVVWIAGGDAKGADLDPLIVAVRDRLVGVVLLGIDAEPFTAALARHAPQIPLQRIDPGDTGEDAGRSRLMEEAVQAARSLAGDGDVVLLAPAAASIDQFRDYAERGDLFSAAVTRLPGERA
ncbi:MAG: UDP-N-acetylmuramoyl-L-alanine--D-glutamate ligase [Brachybacterium sp.]|uniref:UDP-N-acetylmuramoyl-L-alanine--D-glutamate ligase n=1 Tax=Brachybacterium sp. TaxID=1891286 RepID=UPI002655BCDA|nr:UDP-N-acetylmuramoyl-L-alanine--D-glutamate ligase [Brachybacterium sp.]MDN6302094.1 UDP-N-acetylmuramoyl-L-alanine--D-glutamate ligase [Brachybacterium sp.]MDN6328589.1 UDP-N-acetylmuramoyl-L-alanine--D-glutamate ligase [Brachybacterium sp.]MDN6399029.1 UDP-N-acetylmuramoyl-L-alanine--D-glutamate ligase [Brachybacterium sp.]